MLGSTTHLCGAEYLDKAFARYQLLRYEMKTSTITS